MKIISIVNQKGGSGKTTTVSLFAKSFCNEGKKVLIIDTDPQGGISSIYWKGEKKIGLYDILVGDKVELGVNVFHSKVNELIDIIPSDYRLDKIFLTIAPFSLEDCLKDFIKAYDYVLIDTPPTLQGITRASIFFSDKIFVPCEISTQSLTPTIYTLDSIKENKKTAKVIFVGWKEPEEKHGFQNNLAREFKETFKKELIGVIPKNVSTISFSSETKKPSQSVKENVITPILGFV